MQSGERQGKSHNKSAILDDFANKELKISLSLNADIAKVL